MSKALSFVALDFRLIKPFGKSFLVLVVMSVAMGFGFKSTETLSAFFMMSLMLTMSYPFTISEKNGLDILYGTLSLSRRTMVLGRYLFVLALEVLCVLMVFVCAFSLSKVVGIPFVFAEMAMSLCLLSGIFSMVVAVQYPIYFKYGYTKARFLAMAPLLLVFFAVIQLPTFAKLFNWGMSWEGIFAGMMNSPWTMYAMPVAIGLVCLGLSCLLSCRIYVKRDL